MKMNLLCRIRKITNSMNKNTIRFVHWGCLGIICIYAILVRLHLLGMPLDRDEGEYAYMGQLLLKGFAPFELAYNMKIPGLSFIYAGFMSVLGQIHQAIHFGLICVVFLTGFFVFHLANRLFGRLPAVLSAGAYLLLSLSPKMQGFSANAEHFVLLFSLPGILLLLKALDERRSLLLFLSGALFGLAVIMKTHGIMFVAFGGCILLADIYNKRSLSLSTVIRSFFVYLAGAALPYGILCLHIYQAGTFDRFWIWTVTYARTYISGDRVAWGLLSSNSDKRRDY